jgi:hypothetical protein
VKLSAKRLPPLETLPEITHPALAAASGGKTAFVKLAYPDSLGKADTGQ